MLEDGEEEEATPVERPVEMTSDLRKPSEEQVRRHEGHPPAVPQLVLGVRGRGKNNPHRVRRGEKGLQDIHFEFIILGERADPGGAGACIVAREVDARMALAMMVSSKSGDHFVVGRVMMFMSEVGCLHGDVVVWSDPEASIKYSVDDVGRRRASEGGGKWIVESGGVQCIDWGGKARHPVGPGPGAGDEAGAGEASGS